MTIYDVMLPIAAYIYGSIPFGFLFAKILCDTDIRDVGSGNVGATNAARILGFQYFPIVFLLDFSKGAGFAFLGGYLSQANTAYAPTLLAVVCAVAAILGHIFPIFLKFKGGKAVAAGTGACTILAPWAVLIAAGFWAVTFAIFRYVSLASITAASALAVSAWFVSFDPLGAGIYRTVFCTVAGFGVIVLHHSNIRRLLRGEEHKIGKGNQNDQEDKQQ